MTICDTGPAGGRSPPASSVPTASTPAPSPTAACSTGAPAAATRRRVRASCGLPSSQPQPTFRSSASPRARYARRSDALVERDRLHAARASRGRRARPPGAEPLRSVRARLARVEDARPRRPGGPPRCAGTPRPTDCRRRPSRGERRARPHGRALRRPRSIRPDSGSIWNESAAENAAASSPTRACARLRLSGIDRENGACRRALPTAPADRRSRGRGQARSGRARRPRRGPRGQRTWPRARTAHRPPCTGRRRHRRGTTTRPRSRQSHSAEDVVVDGALRDEPPLVEASEAARQLDPFAMQRGRALELADRAEHRGKVQDGACREV